MKVAWRIGDGDVLQSFPSLIDKEVNCCVARPAPKPHLIRRGGGGQAKVDMKSEPKRWAALGALERGQLSAQPIQPHPIPSHPSIHLLSLFSHLV